MKCANFKLIKHYKPLTSCNRRKKIENIFYLSYSQRKPKSVRQILRLWAYYISSNNNIKKKINEFLRKSNGKHDALWKNTMKKCSEVCVYLEVANSIGSRFVDNTRGIADTWTYCSERLTKKLLVGLRYWRYYLFETYI